MKRFFSLFAVTAAITLFLAGCNKYEEGPGISFKSPFSRVAKKWKVEYALVNGEDKTFRYDSASFSFQEDGAIRFVQIVDGDSLEQEGLWDLIEEETQIRLLYTDPPVFPDRAYWDIIRLKDKEMWIREDLDSVINEIRFIPE